MDTNSSKEYMEVVWIGSITTALVLLLTYLLTSIRYLWLISWNGKRQYPPTLPYWIPFLGHTLPFVFNTGGFIKYLGFVTSPPVLG